MGPVCSTVARGQHQRRGVVTFSNTSEQKKQPLNLSPANSIQNDEVALKIYKLFFLTEAYIALIIRVAEM